MEKEVKVMSSDGKKIITGKIVISMNYTTKKEMVHNRGTHEDEEKQIPYSKIEAFREGQKEPIHSMEIKGVNELIRMVTSMEKRLQNSLKLEAESREKLTLEDQLELMGYQNV